MVAQQLNQCGYFYVSLWRDGKNTSKSVHRLIAISFLGDPKGLEVNHKNRIKTDNKVSNLEYVTKSENARHGIANGSSRTPLKLKHYDRCSGQNHWKSKLTQKEVIKIFYSKETLISLGKKYGVSYSNVAAIRNGKTWTRVTSKLKNKGT